MLLNHPPKYLLFGTDSPWQDQKLTIQLLKEMELPAETEDLILWGNAKRLLSEI
jgi:predicted TIM-barrel fold metal-dependent hydrolase